MFVRIHYSKKRQCLIFLHKELNYNYSLAKKRKKQTAIKWDVNKIPPPAARLLKDIFVFLLTPSKCQKRANRTKRPNFRQAAISKQYLVDL
jgi:hypothetical protein